MRIVIIGNGAAGTCAAFTIRKLSKETDIKIFSTEVYTEYSPCVLPLYVSGTLDRRRVFLKSLDDYHQQNIDTFFGERVVSVDVKNKTVLSEKQTVPYDKVIIATGSRSVTPRIPGVNKKGIFFLKSLEDADGILDYSWQRAVVIGSGPIGVEISAALKQQGGTVSLIELERQIMPRVFDKRPASLLQKHLEEHGIRVVTGERASEIQGNNAVRRLLTTNQAIDCDLIILATGVVPEVKLAKQAGLETGKLGGIKVNAQMLTSAPDIYACGDCIEVEDLLTRKPKLSLKWYDARLQAMVAASNCTGKYKEYPGSYEVTNLDLFGLQAVSIGSSESALQTSHNGLEIIERTGYKHYHRFIIRDGRLFGAQLVGHAEYGGSLLSTMLRGDNINNIKDMITCRDLAIVPLMRVVNNYLGQKANIKHKD